MRLTASCVIGGLRSTAVQALIVIMPYPRIGTQLGKMASIGDNPLSHPSGFELCLTLRGDITQFKVSAAGIVVPLPSPCPQKAFTSLKAVPPVLRLAPLDYRLVRVHDNPQDICDDILN